MVRRACPLLERITYTSLDYARRIAARRLVAGRRSFLVRRASHANLVGLAVARDDRAEVERSGVRPEFATASLWQRVVPGAIAALCLHPLYPEYWFGAG